LTSVVFVTGGDGQVATALKNVDSYLCYQFYSRRELDISVYESVVECFEKTSPRLVINTAAYTAVDDAEIFRKEAARINTLGAKVLASACKKFKVPLIHLSTDYVFDGNSTTPYPANSETCPVSIYGQTKCLGEEMVRNYLDEHVILRLSGIFSGHAHCFPRSFLSKALTDQEPKVVTDQITGPTSAHSISLVLDLIATRVLTRKFNWGTYHFAQQPFLSWYDFAQLIIKKAQAQDSRFAEVKVIQITPQKQQDPNMHA
jgi:dTDP-4-dehydrorhamnose reductase